MIRRLTIDIETVPTEAALAAPYPEAERQPPANYKSDEAIAKWREADRIKWADERAKECSLSPRLGRIICIGTSAGLIPCYAPEQERDALETFWIAVDHHRYQYYVATWNGSWDLQFIILRSLALGVAIPATAGTFGRWFKKYDPTLHFDVKAVLTQWAPPKAGEGLAEWAAFFGVEGKTDGWSGARVWPAYQAGEYDAIGAYCMADVAATTAILEKIAAVYDPTAAGDATGFGFSEDDA